MSPSQKPDNEPLLQFRNLRTAKADTRVQVRAIAEPELQLRAEIHRKTELSCNRIVCCGLFSPARAKRTTPVPGFRGLGFSAKALGLQGLKMFESFRFQRFGAFGCYCQPRNS